MHLSAILMILVSILIDVYIYKYLFCQPTNRCYRLKLWVNAFIIDACRIHDIAPKELDIHAQTMCTVHSIEVHAWSDCIWCQRVGS